MSRQEQIDNIIKCLDTATQADLAAIHSLMCIRVPTNKAMLDHPHVMVHQDAYISVGTLGLINGILTAASLPRIAMRWEKDSNGATWPDGQPKMVFTGFIIGPPDVQPEDQRLDVEGESLLSQLESSYHDGVKGIDRILWSFLGLISRCNNTPEKPFNKIVAVLEEHFGVDDTSVSEVTDVRAALAELVATKDMVDAQGKTPEYEARREAAWAQARKALDDTKPKEKAVESDGFAIVYSDAADPVKILCSKRRDAVYLTPRQYGNARGHLKQVFADIGHMKHYLKDDIETLQFTERCEADLKRLMEWLDGIIVYTTPKEG